MDGWLDGEMGRGINGGMHGQLDWGLGGGTDGGIGGWLDGGINRIEGCMDSWMKDWVKGRMEALVDG